LRHPGSRAFRSLDVWNPTRLTVRAPGESAARKPPVPPPPRLAVAWSSAKMDASAGA
jgi:hypothetical protein